MTEQDTKVRGDLASREFHNLACKATLGAGAPGG